MARWLLALVVLGCGPALAATAPRVELSATPAFKGWTRPGRPTEVDVRVVSDAPMPARLEVRAGRSTVHAKLDLRAGQARRVHMPAAAAPVLLVHVASAAAGTPVEVALFQSERPLLAVALATSDPVELPGFQSVAVSADDLPRHAAAHAAVDALLLDATTLAALDPRQLAALLGHAATCGRVVVVGADTRVRALLDGSGACGGRALLVAESLAEARTRLVASLGARLPVAMSQGEAGALVHPVHAVWAYVALSLAACAALMALVSLFGTALPALLAVPALATVAALSLPRALQPTSQLLLWSEAESGSQVARYQGWQHIPGTRRGQGEVPVPTLLGSDVHTCTAAQAVRLEHDPEQGRTVAAAFETRLFRSVALCYSGTFPMARAFRVETMPGAAPTVHNTGPSGWPAGTLLAGGRAYGLPALAAGARARADAAPEPLFTATVQRAAEGRLGADAVAALWTLDLAGVTDLPVGAMGWLLVSGAGR